MQRQRPLPFLQQPDNGDLWERFSEEDRRQVIRLWAELMARTARSTTQPNRRKEAPDNGPK